MSESGSDDKAAAEAIGRPSPFFLRCSERLRALGPGDRVLDLACGRGRHAIAAAELGCAVWALDRKADQLAALATHPIAPPGRIETIEADLEGESPPVLAAAPFSVVMVFRYLHRPLAGWIESLLLPGGCLLYETFTTRQRALGWGPGRDDFLLKPGELPMLFPGLEVLDFSEGPTEEPRPAQTARLLARKPAPSPER